MSIEIARIVARRSPSSSNKACSVVLLRPLATHTMRPLS
jgi:hypothetical protein